MFVNDELIWSGASTGLQRGHRGNRVVRREAAAFQPGATLVHLACLGCLPKRHMLGHDRLALAAAEIYTGMVERRDEVRERDGPSDLAELRCFAGEKDPAAAILFRAAAALCRKSRPALDREPYEDCTAPRNLKSPIVRAGGLTAAVLAKPPRTQTEALIVCGLDAGEDHGWRVLCHSCRFAGASGICGFGSTTCVDRRGLLTSERKDRRPRSIPALSVVDTSHPWARTGGRGYEGRGYSRASAPRVRRTGPDDQGDPLGASRLAQHRLEDHPQRRDGVRVRAQRPAAI